MLSLMLAAVALTSCEDPNTISAADRAKLVDHARGSTEQLKNAEALVRRLNDPGTSAGRKRIRDAAATRQSAEDRQHLIENLMAQEEAKQR